MAYSNGHPLNAEITRILCDKCEANAMFQLTFDNDNAVFRQHGMHEVPRILRKVAEQYEEGQLEGSIIDLNGNTVGKRAAYYE